MPVGDAEPGNQPTGALPVHPIPRAALVTGGAQRIGRALSLALAEDGFAVAVHYHGSRDAAENLAELIRGKGGAAVTLAADLADEVAVSALLPRAEREIGTDRLPGQQRRGIRQRYGRDGDPRELGCASSR